MHRKKDLTMDRTVFSPRMLHAFDVVRMWERPVIAYNGKLFAFVLSGFDIAKL